MDLIRFLKDSGLYEYAKEQNMIIGDRVSGRLGEAWGQLVKGFESNAVTTEEPAAVVSQPAKHPVSEKLTELRKILKETGPQMASQKLMEYCEVPFRLKMSSGKSYTTRSASQTAQKAIREILNTEGLNLELFIQATKAYYSNSHGYRKTFTNYILDGDAYNMYMEAQSSGTTILANNGVISQYVT